jgi:LacI family transcriptional regulator
MANPPRRMRVAVATTILSPYEQGMLRGVIRYSDQAGPWRFFGANNMPYAAFADIDLARIDGVIGGFYSPPWVTAVKEAGIAAVNTTNSRAEIDLPRAGTDDVAIGRMGAEHLLERGYPQFGYLGRGDNWYSHRRLAGFRSVIEEDAGRPCHICPAPPDLPEDDAGPIGPWLADLPKPIGIMAANDVRARQVIDEAVALGFRVPEDVGVLGVDNDEFVSALAARPLSSIALDGLATGYRAAQMLDALLSGQQPHSPYWVQPLGVQVRRSTDVSISEDAIVTEVLRYIRDHCAEPITVSDVLDKAGVSQTTLEVRMKRAIGKTPHAAIQGARIDRSKRMLVESNATIGQVAEACGFVRQERFNVVFKRETGMTPGAFRRQRAR